jgi:hypothetical protein
MTQKDPIGSANRRDVMRYGKLLGVFGAGVLFSALVMTLAFSSQASAGPGGAGDELESHSGSFTAAIQVRLEDHRDKVIGGPFKVYGYSYSGTLMSHGGVKMTIYRCKYKGKRVTVASDLVVVKSAMTIRNGVTFKGKYLCTAQNGYYYYVWWVPAVPGRTGTYKITVRIAGA